MIQLGDNTGICLTPPDGPKDGLMLSLVDTSGPLNRTKVSSFLDANQTAQLIHELRRAFACFAD